MSEVTTVGIVDDDRDMREVIARVLSTKASIRIVASLTSGEEALEQLPKLKPDVVLMDINMDGMGGIEATGRLVELLPATKIIMLTVFEDATSIFNALAAGADGYLLKRMAGKGLISAIRDTLAGGAPMSAPIARKVVASFHREEKKSDKYQLSPRERQVLDCMTRSLAYKEIADELNISMNTVGTHIERIYQKLHVHSRTEAVVKYLRGG